MMELDRVGERVELTASEVHEVIRIEGEHQLGRPALSLLVYGLAAGLAMGVSVAAEAVLRSHLPEAPWREIVSRLGYPVGYLLVILGREQLFTENTLRPVIPFLTKPSAISLVRVLRLWAVVLLANLLGAATFAWASMRLDVFSPEVRHQIVEIGRKSIEHEPTGLFWRGIVAGWLIAQLVWMLPAAKAKMPIIVIVTYVVGLAGLSHIVAGAVDTLALVVEGVTSFDQWLTHWMLPTLAGNVLGGVVLVAVLNHIQVTAEKGKGSG
jgi:formate/nitrite transporter FocA (FNT family)